VERKRDDVKATSETKQDVSKEENEQDDEEDSENESDFALTPTTATATPTSLPGSAFFRTVCCSASAVQAWIWFHSTSFWPSILLGHGQLQHCWDLIIPADDPSDSAYEAQNTLLHYYVLIQASYYVHSVTFRCIRWMVRRRRCTSFILSLIQSVLALTLLGLAYGFSSLRRLAAIGMFALDVSSAVHYF
jgi:hypothetical protein